MSPRKRGNDRKNGMFAYTVVPKNVSGMPFFC